MTRLALIGGSGLCKIPGFHIEEEKTISTPFGIPSASYKIGRYQGNELIFLPRHGDRHTLPPHKINYRANIWGLKHLQVEQIIAVAAVGGISLNMSPQHIAIPDQIIDYSYGREHTFFADQLDSVTHIDFTHPYDSHLRQQLIHAAKQMNLAISPSATYGCTQGPRLETAAEISRMEQDGCDLVGMTGMPETALAKELNMAYATIAVVVNWAAGKTDGVISMEEIEIHLQSGMKTARELIVSFMQI